MWVLLSNDELGCGASLVGMVYLQVGIVVPFVFCVCGRVLLGGVVLWYDGTFMALVVVVAHSGALVEGFFLAFAGKSGCTAPNSLPACKRGRVRSMGVFCALLAACGATHG